MIKTFAICKINKIPYNFGTKSKIFRSTHNCKEQIHQAIKTMIIIIIYYAVSFENGVTNIVWGLASFYSATLTLTSFSNVEVDLDYGSGSTCGRHLRSLPCKSPEN